ncbi:hypothetical protein B7486_61085, partial [cyanobacterium TDX16]
MHRARLAGLAAAVVLLGLTGCSDGEDDTGASDAVDDAAQVDDEGAVDEEPAEDDGFDDDLACGEAALSEDGDYELVTANEVVDGELGPVCYGEEDPVLVDAWTILADIVPEDDLADLGVFAGFDSAEGGDEVTVAFVNMLDDDRFQMSVNLEESQVDPDALTLTLVHEFGHVLTQTPDQLDVDADPDSCPTFYNGAGCSLEGSLMDEWVSTFWAD